MAKRRTDTEKAIAAGIIPEGATVIEETIGDEDRAMDLAFGPGCMAIDYDKVWLESLPARANLSDACRLRFDAEALAFLKCSPARIAYRAACRPATEKAKRDANYHVGPWMARHHRYMETRDPSRWKACEECYGSGTFEFLSQRSKCELCKGHGYTI